jgi:hypothetical protein
MPDVTQNRSPEWWFYGSFAALKFAIQLTFIQGYGWFRDEFYYLACSHQLDFGYVDHPPLSVWILALWRSIFGDSLVATRIPSALAGALTVIVVGRMAYRLGGNRLAQGLAMLTTIATPLYLALNHFYSMNAFDLLFWAVAALMLIEILHGESSSRWVGLGLLLGLGLQNKISVLWLGFGIAVGLLLTVRRRDLATRWPWLGGAVAMLVFAPYIVWQATHDWATLEFIRNATGNKMVEKSAAQFAVDQLMTMGLFSVLVWGSGLVFLFVARQGRFRLLGWIYLAVFALLAFSGSSRSGYLGPAYTWLLAAGAVALTEWFERRRWVVYVLAGFLTLWGAMIAPLALPVLPVERYIEYAKVLGEDPSTEERKELSALKQFYADMHGWDRIVDAVALAAKRLTPEERESAVVYASNYGVAGAVDRLGREHGLPPAVSGHNNYWWWGTRGRGVSAVIAVGGTVEGHGENWSSVEFITETDCGYCMPYENGNTVFLLRGRLNPVDEIWPELRHYD